MTNTQMHSALLASTLAASIGFSGTALAYGKKDAIRDCESRLRSEYSLSDFREQSAEKVMDMDHHYKVKGLTKVDGKKHPFHCEIKERHVTSVNYSGPEPEGMGTAEKLAIGAAAAIAAGLIASEMSKDDDDTGHSGSKHAGGELEQDGFYYDKHVGKWRDPAGDVCHTCTPENGFPKP